MWYIIILKRISCIPHILGDHSNCVHDEQQDCFFWQVGFENPPLVELLEKFVYEQVEILQNTSKELDSQLYQSLNAPKKSCWNRIDGRIASGVIRQNKPLNAPFIIRRCCGAPE